MADVKWIKIAANIFDNRKIRQLENLPDGDSLIVIWIKLLCLAGNVNDNGFVYFTQEIPYTEQMLSAQFNRPIATVQIALGMFEKFGMVELINDILKISNWEKYQNVDKMNEIREYNRLAQQRHRQRLASKNDVNDESMTGQPCHDTDTDIDIDSELDTDSDGESEKNTTPQAESERIQCPYSKIKDLYNSICISYPEIKTVDGNRMKAVAARWRTYKNIEIFSELFRIAESSLFLKGQNDRNWSADFDWMMKPTNFTKILEHKYDERGSSDSRPTGVLGALARMYEEADNNDGKGSS